MNNIFWLIFWCKTDCLLWNNTSLEWLISLAEKQPNFSMLSQFENCVTEDWLAIFNINGTLRKCQKSKLVHQMSLQRYKLRSNYMTLMDIGFLWRKSAPPLKKEKNEETEYTWSDWSWRIFQPYVRDNKMQEQQSDSVSKSKIASMQKDQAAAMSVVQARGVLHSKGTWRCAASKGILFALLV